MEHAVEFIDETEQIPSGVLEEMQKLISGALDLVLGQNGFAYDALICVSFVTADQIRETNARMRGIDRETDVLSFPMLRLTPGHSYHKKGRDVDVATGKVYLGDVALSLAAAQEQAQRYGHSFQREAAYLCTHGFLHLLGYDHENDIDKERMRAQEESVMQALGLRRE